MFASYKSQSTGNQKEADDIITLSIKHKWSPHSGERKAIGRTPNEPHTAKREVRPRARSHRCRQEPQAPSLCSWPGVEPSLPSWPSPMPRQAFPLTNASSSGVQATEAGHGTCRPPPSHPDRIVEGRLPPERIGEQSHDLAPGSLPASDHPSQGTQLRRRP